jgi:5-hydroxyisourate hydrolase-like protein (transthyretin family)
MAFGALMVCRFSSHIKTLLTRISLMTKPIGLTWLILILMTIISCGSDANHWPEKQGHVLDEATGKPVKDAYVVAFWKGIASYATEVCFHTESTTTDGKGQFEIPAWTNTGEWLSAKDQYIAITVYKEGFKTSDKTYRREQTHKKGKYYLSEDTSSGGDRIKALESILKAGGCTIGRDADESYSNAFSMFEAIYKEAKQHAKTNDEEKVVYWIGRIAASSALHPAEIPNYSYEKERQAIDKFIKEQLDAE